MLKIYLSKEYKMQNSSPDNNDPSRSSIIYNDSGYLTNINPEPSFSSNSEPSFENSEDISLHSKSTENVSSLHSVNGIYFCENAVFDEPKFEGPPMLWDNTNNYEQFSNLIKFSLDDTNSYINTNVYSSDSEYCENISNKPYQDVPQVSEDSESVLQYFNQDSLSSFSSLNPSQSICMSEMQNTQNVVFQAVEQCLTSQDDNKTETTNEQQINNNTDSAILLPSQPECNKQSLSNSVAQKTPVKPYVNKINPDLSPELFSDDENSTEQVTEIEHVQFVQKKISLPDEFVKNDRKLLKRVQETLSGVPPPPSVTILQLSISDMLNKINNNKHLFLSENSEKLNSDTEKTVTSLLIVSSKKDVEDSNWPNIVKCRYHGLYYNRSKESEDFEHFCTKYATRYVGVETASSCTLWSTTAPNSATKRRNARLRWGLKSPGRRLSHLAKRRITFSSSNLQQSGGSMSVIGNSSMSKQLMIDTRKTICHKRKSPRKNPCKKSPRKTPNHSSQKSSSTRRLNLDADDSKPGCSKVSSTKRALFQSPEHNRSTISSFDTSSQFIQKPKSRKSLFMSPNKKSPAKNLNCDKKRKRSEEDCVSNKFPRSLSFDVHHSNALDTAARETLPRRNSESVVRSTSTRGELSDLHKQKMLWAVSEALRAQQITMSHPQFRTFALLLCKIIKHLVPDLMSNGPRQPGSTSDRMLRIARQHSYAVTRGKSFEEIMQQIKETNMNLKNSKPPTGYVGPDSGKIAHPKNILQDKVMNIESNLKVESKGLVDTKNNSVVHENSKLKSIRRQIIFDDTEITKSCNANR